MFMLTFCLQIVNIVLEGTYFKVLSFVIFVKTLHCVLYMPKYGVFPCPKSFPIFFGRDLKIAPFGPNLCPKGCFRDPFRKKWENFGACANNIIGLFWFEGFENLKNCTFCPNLGHQLRLIPRKSPLTKKLGNLFGHGHTP